MHAPIEFAFEGDVDHPMGLDATFAPERLGDHLDPEVRLALGPVPGVALVKIGFVDHIYPDGTKSLG